MSCPCETLNCEDCIPEIATPPCNNGESCIEISDAACIPYTGPDLNNIGIKTGDRLNIILNKLNVNHASEGINVITTQTTSAGGSGTLGAPLAINVNIDAQPRNYLTVGTEGLAVRFTKANLQALFTFIASDADIKTSFCALVNTCGTCGIVTDMGVTMT